MTFHLPIIKEVGSNVRLPPTVSAGTMTMMAIVGHCAETIDITSMSALSGEILGPTYETSLVQSICIPGHKYSMSRIKFEVGSTLEGLDWPTRCWDTPYYFLNADEHITVFIIFYAGVKTGRERSCIRNQPPIRTFQWRPP